MKVSFTDPAALERRCHIGPFSPEKVTDVAKPDPAPPPATFDDLVQNWYRFVLHVMAEQGIKPDDRSDLAQEILLRFWRNKRLEQFDPGRASFSSYLAMYVRLWARHMNVEHAPHKAHESVLSEPVAANIPAPEEPDVVLALEGRQETLNALKATYEALVQSAGKNKAELFLAMVEQVERDGKCDFAAIAHRRGVTRQAVNYSVNKLRQSPVLAGLKDYLVSALAS